jgi:polyhydroxyalkanoate synthase
MSTETVPPRGGRRQRAAGERRPAIAQDGHVNDVGLDQVIAQAANQRRHLLPGTEAVSLAAALARRPDHLARRGARLAGELARVLAGRSQKAPPRGDSRFRDPAWQRNWAFRRVLQSYLSISENALGLLDDAHLDWQADQRLRAVAENLLDVLAPTNFPLTNPAVWKATVERGGENFVQGARALARDMRSPVRLPASVDGGPFEVGRNLAAAPGAVVARQERFELLQYEPRTPEVLETPVLLIPPMISKFYVVDLAPGKSMVEFLGGHGLQPFAVSWKNPGRRERAWGMKDYVGSILEALQATREITSSPRVHLVGFCAGGVATTIATALLAARGELDRVASMNVMVTVLDMSRAGRPASFLSERVARRAKANVARKGYLAGTELTRTFAWLRPNDMIWNNFVNNYYLGNKPPAFDLLYWNLDSMNMPAALHADMVDIGLANPLLEPGGLQILGSPIDVRQIDCDAYIVGGETDHLTPWPSCYRSTSLLGGHTRFVLSTGGHIAAVIHPPGNPKSAYITGAEEYPEDAQEWLASGQRNQGSWWEDWAPWLTERSGEAKVAPVELGSAANPSLGPAPGTYVFERSTG